MAEEQGELETYPEGLNRRVTIRYQTGSKHAFIEVSHRAIDLGSLESFCLRNIGREFLFVHSGVRYKAQFYIAGRTVPMIEFAQAKYEAEQRVATVHLRAETAAAGTTEES